MCVVLCWLCVCAKFCCVVMCCDGCVGVVVCEIRCYYVVYFDVMRYYVVRVLRGMASAVKCFKLYQFKTIGA